MPLAREGLREITAGTFMLAGVAMVLAGLIHWAAALPFAIVWLWLISFFRDPRRITTCTDREFCAPADGTVTEVTHLDHHDLIGGPAWRVGIFLSIFNVHANRSPCAGTVKSTDHQKGRFLDARHRDSGSQNEANTVVIDPGPPLAGPVVVRQVAGYIARRIICHAVPGDHLAAGQRFGMIKFGSRTELIVPAGANEVVAKVGDKVHAGLTILARQATSQASEQSNAGDPENRAT